jgi:hypothetical protein
MPVRLRHDIENLPDVVFRNVLMEQVAHAIHEDLLRLLPGEGPLKHARLQR